MPKHRRKSKLDLKYRAIASPRAVHRPVSEFKALLRVDVDWCSGSIWEIPEPGYRYAGVCASYEALGLPDWLIQRFEYWTSWHDSVEPWSSRLRWDADLYGAYALSLAINLKRFLGDDYYVEYHGREIHDDRAYLRSQLSHEVTGSAGLGVATRVP